MHASDIVFETERLVARRWDPDLHAPGAHAMYGDPEVMRHIEHGAPKRGPARPAGALAAPQGRA